MFKYTVLAIATANAALTPREIEAAEITKGILAGAAAAENFGDMATCIADLEAVVADAEGAIADIKKGDPADILAALKLLEDLLAKVESLKADCTATIDIAKVKKMMDSIHNMRSFAMHVGKDIVVNGKDILK